MRPRCRTGKGSFLAAGYAEDDIVIAESGPASVSALESGKRVALADASLIAETPVDIVVEATGNPEAAAQVGLAALSAGKHLAMVSKGGGFRDRSGTCASRPPRWTCVDPG